VIATKDAGLSETARGEEPSDKGSSVNLHCDAPFMRTTMGASAVKSSEFLKCARHTFTPCCRRQASLDYTVLPAATKNARPTSSQLAAAVKSDLGRATTTSSASQSGETDHPITSALRRASCSPEASEPHLSSGVSGEHSTAFYGSLAPAQATPDRSPDAIPFVPDLGLSAGADRCAFQDRPLGNNAGVQIAPEIND
jgi:hypothetical protein